MILCLCRGVSEREVADAIRGGARTLEDVKRRCTGAGGSCGACRPLIEDQLRRRLREAQRAA
jgi:nitrite reductase (NADH) large subunit